MHPGQARDRRSPGPVRGEASRDYPVERYSVRRGPVRSFASEDALMTARSYLPVPSKTVASTFTWTRECDGHHVAAGHQHRRIRDYRGRLTARLADATFVPGETHGI